MVRWKAVSKQATCGTSGAVSNKMWIGSRLCGWCSGARGTNFSNFASTWGSTRRSRVLLAAVQDPVADCHELVAFTTLTQEAPQIVDGPVMSERLAGLPTVLGKQRAP